MSTKTNEVILHHEIGKTKLSSTLEIIIREDRSTIYLEQNGKTILIDRWQALELARELLNNREYLKTNVVSLGTKKCETTS